MLHISIYPKDREKEGVECCTAPLPESIHKCVYIYRWMDRYIVRWIDRYSHFPLMKIFSEKAAKGFYGTFQNTRPSALLAQGLFATQASKHCRFVQISVFSHSLSELHPTEGKKRLIYFQIIFKSSFIKWT